MNEDLEKILNDELEGILSDDIPKNYRYDGDGSKKYIKYVIIAIPLLLLILYFAFGMNFTNNSLTTDERMYEIYSLAASSGFNGTYEEWLDSISGADGANGENIELRINGTIVQWKYVTELDSNWKTLYSIADYSGVDGLSALELWIVANKFVGTEAQATEAFFDSLNVYGLWLAQGNKGSEEDFLNSLKGENGLDGVDVSYSVYLIYQSLGYTGDYNTWLDLYESSTSNPLPDFDFGFAKEEYEVKFEISGIIDSSLTQTIEEGKKVTSVDAPTKENYTFIGWFVGEEQWVFSGFTVTEDITLVAKFELTEYTIGYDLNGGVNNSSNPNTITYDDVVVLVDPTKVGYTFSGWTESNGELSQINSNITLTATWELATYEITYKLNDGVNNSSNPNTINYTQTIELVSPAKAGYEFVEWRNDYNMVVTSLSLISNDITLTAIWNETQFPITYELKGGTNAYYNPSNITINDTFYIE